MRPRTRPPINGDALREARMRKGMTQEQVQDECAKHGVPLWNLSRMENGDLKWPNPRVFPVLADVLGLEIPEMFAPAQAAA